MPALSGSHGMRRKVCRSTLASRSRYPFAAFEMVSSLKYVRSCMSQPKTTEQKPKPVSTIERNFFLEMILPGRSASGCALGAERRGTSQHAVDVDAGELDLVVILQSCGDGRKVVDVFGHDGIRGLGGGWDSALLKGDGSCGADGGGHQALAIHVFLVMHSTLSDDGRVIQYIHTYLDTSARSRRGLNRFTWFGSTCG